MAARNVLPTKPVVKSLDLRTQLSHPTPAVLDQILGDWRFEPIGGSSDFIHANIFKTRKVKKGIKKHRAVSCQKNKAIAVDPVWLSWIDTKLLCKEAIGRQSSPITTPG